MRAVAGVLALLLLGCGGGGGGGSTDAGAADGRRDAGASDGGAGRCDPAAPATSCPARPCEVAVGCAPDGGCRYEPLRCGEPGRACPVETCVATMEGGRPVGRCEVVEAGPCGEGGTCVGSRCVVAAEGLRLVGELSVGRVGATVGGLTLEGEIGFTPERLAPLRSGPLRLTGGLAP